MNNTKPIIGLTSNIMYINDVKTNAINLSYSEAIKRNGGIPIIFSLGNDELAKKWVSMVDGVMLTGGNDVHPKFYHEEPSDKLGLLMPELDEADMKIINEARKQGKPLFGICRGSHLINVAMGGTMNQDIEEDRDKLSHLSNDERTKPTHKAYVKKDSYLYRLVKKEVINVNSFHHQSMKDIGEGLKCVAEAEDGVPEAIEGIDEPIIATQFHPEDLGKVDASMDNILECFIRLCKK